MKSAIFFALAIVPALTGFLTAADPLDAPATAFAPVENSPPPARARLKKPAGPPIGLIIRVYEMDTEKLKESIDFNPMKEDRKTVNGQFEEFRKAGLVKLIAEPHLVTQDGRQATMLAGGEVPVYVPASKDSVAIDFIEFGTRVEVTPRQLKQDRVQIKIAVEFTRRSARGLTVENVKEGTNPVIVGRMIRAVTTLGPKDIIVLNDSEAREEDEPRKVNFMTIELADLGVEEALLQFDEEAQDVIQPPPVVPEQPTRVDVNDLPLETAPSKAGYDLFEEKPLPAPRTPKKTPTPTAPKNSFYLKPGKTQLEIVRGTWQSLTIPSKDFGFGSSLLVESPEEGAISISGRILTPWEERPAKSETFEAGGSGGKYAADIWTIKGVKPGIATIRLIDDHDQEYEIEVTVKGDTRHFDAMVKRFHPKAKVEAHELTEDSVVITGEATPEDVIAIQEIAQQLYSQVLLRLKTQRVPLNHDFPAALEGTLNETGADYSEPLRPTIETPGEIDSDAPANTFPKSSEVGSSNYPVRISDTNDDPALSTPIGVDTPQPANGFAPENQVGADADPGPVHPEGFDEFVGLEPAKVANAVVGYRKSSKPPVATTQVRFLSDGLISMQSPTEPGAFQRVQSWVDWSTWKYIGGQRQQVRYRTHRETLPQGSRTPFQFQTTEFRNDVWVNGLLLTAIGNDRTHYRLQHFPVDLVLERHEIEAAARGQLVTRIVVMKEDRPSVLTEEGKSVEPREAFTGPNSFAEAIAEGQKHGELLAVLVLGPDALLQKKFSIPGSPAAATNGHSAEGEFDPHGERTIVDKPKVTEGTTEADNHEDSRWRARPDDGSVSSEMRQLRHEVRSLRQQLGKLVEVLSREHAADSEKEEPDRVTPASPGIVPNPVDPDRNNFDRGDAFQNDPPTPLPSPSIDAVPTPRGKVTPGSDGAAAPNSLSPFGPGSTSADDSDLGTPTLKPDLNSTPEKSSRPISDGFGSPFGSGTSSKSAPIPDSTSETLLESTPVPDKFGVLPEEIPEPVSK